MPNIAGIVLHDPTPRLIERPGLDTIGKEVKATVKFIKFNVSGTKTVLSYVAKHKGTATGREIRSRITQRTDSPLLNNSRFVLAASNYSNRFFTQEGAVLVKPGEESYEHIVDFYDVEECGLRQGDRKLPISVTLEQDGFYLWRPYQGTSMIP